MKRIFTVVALIIGATGLSAQCTTTNATSCVCATQGQTDCDLLPDLQASWKSILDNDEYPQTGAGTNYSNQGPDDGRLRVSVSSPTLAMALLPCAVQIGMCVAQTPFNQKPARAIAPTEPRHATCLYNVFTIKMAAL